ncbi:YsnF/AvaK domain-containing protein [Noviherbaspirillum sp. 17J57-3]|uniref:YsnF/AvaK domain-containing protein n=2 Tax=Noviherbaspirillum galbum TaxID=2709383 RepID=A0A6B3SHN5_9BURK|nr:YsnF/AvaK domain-containing protein [Noviherbaspirillum galbum]
MTGDDTSDVRTDRLSSGGHAVVGVYDNASDAQSAVQALESAGIPRSSIELNTDATGTYGATDTTLGTAASASRTSATTRLDDSTTVDGQHERGSGIGNFFRSLFGMDDDVRREDHDVYNESLRRGSQVLTVEARDDDEAERITDILSRYNPVDIDDRASHWRQQGWSGYDASAPRFSQDEIQRDRDSYLQARAGRDTTRDTTQTGESARIPVVEEQLKVGKRQIERGGIRVYQRVRETPVHETVELREEHVRVERRPVDKKATEADIAAFKDKSVELRETAEEAVVSKTARVVEEVVVNKEATQRTEQINDTVRRTDVEVEKLGASDTRRTAGVVDDDAYRRHWQSTYGSAGGSYEDYDAAYRYGSSMAGNDRYKNYRWEDVEPQVRSDWESNHPESTWDKVKDAVRYGAERVTGNRGH